MTGVLVAAIAWLLGQAAPAVDRGAAILSTQCAACHDADGSGGGWGATVVLLK